MWRYLQTVSEGGEAGVWWNESAGWSGGEQDGSTGNVSGCLPLHAGTRCLPHPDLGEEGDGSSVRFKVELKEGNLFWGEETGWEMFQRNQAAGSKVFRSSTRSEDIPPKKTEKCFHPRLLRVDSTQQAAGGVIFPSDVVLPLQQKGVL